MELEHARGARGEQCICIYGIKIYTKIAQVTKGK